ncbi:hypothetical protein BOTBODRAFT_171539 [Botryobasidium botryosum FD-172 SS1]|uniref:GST N-terminal domain-containing protein n=1 Tax=Botryobasidium botryosum (strain FD-172 SS1) TaxID=930990 RepID=A0A067MQK6_BOTB1|nr:hypothetical protein BOTBODRAFT_171539 [Botryobasidium botryosum FD-172 SS1]
MVATESNPIILYDLKSKLAEPGWSPHAWKARFVLNYKRLPHKTVWLSYPEIEPTLKALGLPPLVGEYVDYTIPVIVDPAPPGSGAPPTIVRDSVAIAKYLDATYPDPERPIFPNGTRALQVFFERHITKQIITYSPLPILIVPLIPSILDDLALPHFRRTRDPWYGVPIEEARPKGAALEEAWAKVKEEFDVLDAILEENSVERGGDGGDFVLGHQISFADFTLVGLFVLLSKFQPEEDGCPWYRVKRWHGGRWERMWKKCEGLMQVVASYEPVSETIEPPSLNIVSYSAVTA